MPIIPSRSNDRGGSLMKHVLIELLHRLDRVSDRKPIVEYSRSLAENSERHAYGRINTPMFDGVPRQCAVFCILVGSLFSLKLKDADRILFKTCFACTCIREKSALSFIVDNRMRERVVERRIPLLGTRDLELLIKKDLDLTLVVPQIFHFHLTKKNIFIIRQYIGEMQLDTETTRTRSRETGIGEVECHLDRPRPIIEPRKLPLSIDTQPM